MNILDVVGGAIRSLWAGNTEERPPQKLAELHDSFVGNMDAIRSLDPTNPETHTQLLHYFSSPERHVRWAAVQAFGRANPEKATDSRAIRGVISLLGDTEPEVRRESLSVLGKIPEETLRSAIGGMNDFGALNKIINSLSSNDLASKVGRLLQNQSEELERIIDSNLH